MITREEFQKRREAADKRLREAILDNLEKLIVKDVDNRGRLLKSYLMKNLFDRGELGVKNINLLPEETGESFDIKKDLVLALLTPLATIVLLGFIFATLFLLEKQQAIKNDNINKEICSDCPLARRKTVLEVEGRYGFEIWSKEAGCCSSCKKYMGHFSDVNNGSPIEYMECKQVLERLKKKYKYDDKLYGFFDSLKKECKLPREKRSL
ncbi:hypothetical protein LCGC14_1881120, partial [marine sediment metagenome]